MFKTKMTSKGQVTIPKELRDRIGIKPGSYLEINETEAGYVITKHVDEEYLYKYVGILKGKKSSDKVVKELRGE